MLQGDHGRSARHCFDHGQAERLWPINGKQQRPRLSQEFVFFLIVNLADKLNQWMLK
jgi:hypothetical protein